MRAAAQYYPVFSVDAWSEVHLGDPGGVQPVPELTWRDRRFIEQLEGQRKLEFRELRTGPQVVTRSHVGYVPFEGFALRIHPKISHGDMLRMMQYAYEFDDLTAYERTGAAATVEFAPEELVIAGLVFHLRKLARRGLYQTYVEEEAELSTVRGRIRFAELATRSRVGVTLPCRYERRTPDVLVNRILTGGLVAAQRLTSNPWLLQELARLRMFFEENVTPVRLTDETFRTAERELTRLNEHYRPALDLCCLIHAQATIDGEMEGRRHFPGFLIDMNQLFERFIGRLLDDIAPRGHRIDKQSRRPFYTASLGQRAPHLRPDFRILDPDDRVATIIDAKYKFYDERAIDVSDLYQLTIYGLADGPMSGTVIALYPGSRRPDGSPADNHLRDNDRTYSFDGPNRRRLGVIFRRVDLGRVWEAVDVPEKKAELYAVLAGPQRMR